MDSLNVFIRDLRKFEGRKELVRELRKEFRKPIPAVRKSIRARALSTLPAGGGLNKWAAKTRITADVKLSGRTVSVRLIGKRDSAKGKSDVNALDRGRVRHPSWGRRGAGQWHTQTVKAGFFSSPSTEVDQWRKACIDATDRATEVIRGGR